MWQLQRMCKGVYGDQPTWNSQRPEVSQLPHCSLGWLACSIASTLRVLSRTWLLSVVTSRPSLRTRVEQAGCRAERKAGAGRAA